MTLASGFLVLTRLYAQLIATARSLVVARRCWVCGGVIFVLICYQTFWLRVASVVTAGLCVVKSLCVVSQFCYSIKHSPLFCNISADFFYTSSPSKISFSICRLASPSPYSFNPLPEHPTLSLSPLARPDPLQVTMPATPYRPVVVVTGPYPREAP